MNLKNTFIGEAYCLVGPTASGKTEAALQIAQKRTLTLISVDSMQVYKGMDIGTAKAREEIRHNFELIDMVDPGDKWSVAQFCRRAAPLAQEAWEQGSVPLFVGGTGLYFEGLFTGLAQIPDINDHIRAEIDALREEGREGLAEALLTEDPLAASKIDLQNPQRIGRALEVFRQTGRSIVSWQENTLPALKADKVHWIGLDPGVLELDEIISKRVKAMMDSGWVEEAAGLAKKFGKAQLLSTGAIGYEQALNVSENKMSLAEAIERITILTRQYARRQRTWFRNRANPAWYPNAMEIILP